MGRRKELEVALASLAQFQRGMLTSCLMWNILSGSYQIQKQRNMPSQNETKMSLDMRLLSFTVHMTVCKSCQQTSRVSFASNHQRH